MIDEPLNWEISAKESVRLSYLEEFWWCVFWIDWIQAYPGCWENGRKM